MKRVLIYWFCIFALECNAECRNCSDTINIKFIRGSVGMKRIERPSNKEYVQYIITYTRKESKNYIAFLLEGKRGQEITGDLRNIKFTDKMELAREYNANHDVFLRRKIFFVYEYDGTLWIKSQLKCRYLGADIKNDYSE